MATSVGGAPSLADRLPLAQTPRRSEKHGTNSVSRPRRGGGDRRATGRSAFAIASQGRRCLRARAPDVSAAIARRARRLYATSPGSPGTAAFSTLRPADAEGMFARYATARQCSIKAKGYYWAGDAALAAAVRTPPTPTSTQRRRPIPINITASSALERLGRPVPDCRAPTRRKSSWPRRPHRASAGIRSCGPRPDARHARATWVRSEQVRPRHCRRRRRDRPAPISSPARTGPHRSAAPTSAIMAGRRATASGLSRL